VTAPPLQVWADRASEICKLREQGKTLANIGRRFRLSAERVRQILSDECPALPDVAEVESPVPVRSGQ
jgi:lambda repressor-like predicted transcriptional regulator